MERFLLPRVVRVSGVLVVAVLLSPTHLFAQGRFALVIGNGAYTMSEDRSARPAAMDVGTVLASLGFAVTEVLDGDAAIMKEALVEFGERSASASVAVVFFSGYGAYLDGNNYLLPVDATMQDLAEPSGTNRQRFEAIGERSDRWVSLRDVIQEIEDAELKVVIMDAGGGLGMPPVWEFQSEVLVAYGAEPQRDTMLDAEGRSYYAAALVRHLGDPVEILTVFRRVRAEVVDETNGRQRPTEHQSLLGEHYLSEVSQSLR